MYNMFLDMMVATFESGCISLHHHWLTKLVIIRIETEACSSAQLISLSSKNLLKNPIWHEKVPQINLEASHSSVSRHLPFIFVLIVHVWMDCHLH